MEFRDRVLQSARRANSRIVLALDVSGSLESRVERAIAKLDSLIDGIACVKINQQLLLPFGLYGLKELINLCNDRSVPVIADMKLNDIESTNMDAINSLFSMGFDAIIANPFVGYKEGLGTVIRRSRELGRGVILLVYMSHKGAREGYDLRADGKAIWRIFASRVRKWKADGAIVSAKSLSRIREVRETLLEDQLIFCPGVGVQGGDARKAIRAGADFVIVGRSITDAPNSVKALANLRLATQAHSRGTLQLRPAFSSNSST